MEQYYQINANDLYEDEISYELALRHLPVNVSLPTRMRNLRQALREPETEKVQLIEGYSLEEDYTIVPQNLQEIVHRMENNQPKGCWSRLVHYHKRVRRYVAGDRRTLDNQELLLDLINRLAIKYFKVDMNQFVPQTDLFLVVKSPHGVKIPFRQLPDSDLNPNVRTNVEAVPVLPSTSTADLVVPEVTSAEDEGAWGGTTATTTSVLVSSCGDGSTSMSPLRVSPTTSSAPPVTSINTGAIPKRPSLDKVYEQLKVFLENPMATSPSIDSADLSVLFQTPEFRSAFVQAMNSVKPTMTREDSRSSVVSSFTAMNTSTPTVSATATRPTPLLQSTQPTTTVPEGARRQLDMSKFVHIDEIQGYIKACVNSIIHNGPRCPEDHQQSIDGLVEQITNVGIHDSEVTNISRGVGAVPQTVPFQINLDPPFQLPTAIQGGSTQTTLPGMVDSSRILPNFNRPVVTEAQPVPRSDVGFQQQESRGNGLLLDSQNLQLPPNPADQFWDPPVPGPSDPNAGHGRPNEFPPMLQGGSQGYGRQRLPHQTCNIIEKWPKFSGDASPYPVADFLRQIACMSRSYKVSTAELRVHAHLLFKDDAYTWFMAYDYKLDTWETLVAYLRMRYDNPNRDKFIRDEMRLRKQKPNEKFSAYLTDMESMASRMVHPMSQAELYNLVTENMKMSYKRRLLLVRVESLTHLSQLCFQFDALEGTLNNPRQGKPGVNQIAVDEEPYDEDDEVDEPEVLVVQPKPARPNRSTLEPVPAPRRRAEEACWNCRQLGHMWRDCSQKKRFFCHICGQEDTVASQCPKRHNLFGSKNE